MQTSYREIYAGIQQRNTSIVFSNKLTTEKINEVLMYVGYDHPDIFINKRNKIRFGIKTELLLSYIYSPMEEKRILSDLETRADKIIASLRSDSKDLEFAIYDYVVLNFTYATENQSEHHTLEYTLRNQRGVCEGIALTLSFLMCRAGFECSYISGILKPKESHGWNIIRIDGKLYHLDVTSDLAQGDCSLYAHYNCSDEQMKYDHIWKLNTNCNDDSKSFIKNNAHSVSDVEGIIDVMRSIDLSPGMNLWFNFVNRTEINDINDVVEKINKDLNIALTAKCVNDVPIVMIIVGSSRSSDVTRRPSSFFNKKQSQPQPGTPFNRKQSDSRLNTDFNRNQDGSVLQHFMNRSEIANEIKKAIKNQQDVVDVRPIVAHDGNVDDIMLDSISDVLDAISIKPGLLYVFEGTSGICTVKIKYKSVKTRTKKEHIPILDDIRSLPAFTAELLKNSNTATFYIYDRKEIDNDFLSQSMEKTMKLLKKNSYEYLINFDPNTKICKISIE